MDQGKPHPTNPHPPKPASATFTAFGIGMEADRLQPGLHVVATPIGNLRDISFRGVATLAAADAVIAEDTRVTKTLLAHYGVTTPLVTYHEHNASVVRPHLLARLESGAALALVSDAGTPLISDPGFKLVAESDALHNPDDNHTLKIFDPALRGHTDQFILKFRKPKG